MHGSLKKGETMGKLTDIQNELKAPKGQYNSYGGYKYRSCEDILEAVKPLLKKYDCSLKISDEIVQIGDRYYIKATATLVDDEKHFTKHGLNEDFTLICTNTAYAREEETKKGMDSLQITGTASSYARKYALNGLFLIDDNKDADTDEHAKQTGKEKKEEKPKATPKQIELLKAIAKKQGKELDEEAVKNWSMEKASVFISENMGVK